MEFKQPPIIYNEQGEVRKAGFELEYANLGIEDSARLIQELYGGELRVEHRFSQEIIGTSLGDFSIEIDLRLLNEKGYKKHLQKFNINLQDYQVGNNTLEFEVESILEGLASTLIPYEITTPPLPITEIYKLEPLRLALFEHHAEGTKHALLNAFATHINPEVPSKQPQSILSYIRAFLLLYPWMLKKLEIDIARRTTAFINPFPARYIEMVLNPAYNPDLEKLIEDYHEFNPDRNRPLDMYPLFAALRKEKIDSYHDIGKVNPRETFHYRLPNSLIDSPDWSLAREWNNWVIIEELAYDPEKIEQLSRNYLDLRHDTIIGFDYKWIKQTDKWLS